MAVEFNQQQIASALRVVLGTGGPIAAIILAKTGVTEGDYTMYMNAALVVVPPIAAFLWGWYSNRKVALVANVAQMPAEDQHAALNKLSDVDKVKIVEAVPAVATVVIKDAANGAIAKVAQSEAHPNVVTESQNALDKKAGASQ